MLPSVFVRTDRLISPFLGTVLSQRLRKPFGLQNTTLTRDGAKNGAWSVSQDLGYRVEIYDASRRVLTLYILPVVYQTGC